MFWKKTKERNLDFVEEMIDDDDVIMALVDLYAEWLAGTDTTRWLLIIYWSFKKCFYHNDCSNVHNTSQFVCELRTTCTTWTRQCGTVALPMPYLCELCTCWSMCYVCVCLFIFLLYELITDVIIYVRNNNVVVLVSHCAANFNISLTNRVT